MIAHTSQSGAPAAASIAEESGSVLHVLRAVYEELRAHGEETYPRECCGALLGKPAAGGWRDACGWRIEALMRTANAHTDFARYEIAPPELVKIANEARSLGLEIAGFYHSHPDHAVQWSAADLDGAHWVGLSYMITEVVKGKAAITRAWLLAGTREEDKHFEPQEMRIEDC